MLGAAVAFTTLLRFSVLGALLLAAGCSTGAGPDSPSSGPTSTPAATGDTATSGATAS